MMELIDVQNRIGLSHQHTLKELPKKIHSEISIEKNELKVYSCDKNHENITATKT